MKMKNIISFLLLSFYCLLSISAQNPIDNSIPARFPPPNLPVGTDVNFSNIIFGEFIDLYAREMLTPPYVICNEVLADQRRISIKASGKKDIDIAVLKFLIDQQGYELRKIGAVTTLCSPADPSKVGELYTYKPNYRSVSEISDIVKTMVFGVFASERTKAAFSPAPSQSVGNSSNNIDSINWGCFWWAWRVFYACSLSHVC